MDFGSCTVTNVIMLLLPQYFIKTFRAIIDSASSDTRQMSIAIRGYGYFSKV